MLSRRIGSLERGALAALNGNRPDLAKEAAMVIAATEDERKDRQTAVEQFDSDIDRLRRLTEEGQRRMRGYGGGWKWRALKRR